MKYLFLFIACFIHNIFAVEKEAITRETIEAILNVVSPGCRAEIESALETQVTQVSDDCKREIQGALQQFSSPRGGQPKSSFVQEEEPAAAQEEPVKREGLHPGIWIAVAVFIFFGGVGAYVSYANKILKEAFPEKPQKKLSQKKLEKQKRKAN